MLQNRPREQNERERLNFFARQRERMHKIQEL